MNYYDPNRPNGRSDPRNRAPRADYQPDTPSIRRRTTVAPTSRPPQRRPQGSGWGLGCGMFLLGFVVAAVIAGVTVFFLYFYNPDPLNGPLNRPPEQSGTPDINATLSQTYLNKEITRQLNGKPIKAGPVEIRDLVINIQANSRIEIQVRAASGPVTFDLSITEQVSIQNGQVKLDATGQPKITGGQLPVGVNTIVEAINTQFVEPQINQQVSKIAVNGRPVRLLDLTTSPGFLNIKANIP